MRRITILALGTRGDVQPAIALGLGLQRAGHSVRLAAPPLSRELVTSHGLEFAALGNPPQASGQQLSLAATAGFVAEVAFHFVRTLFARGSAPVWPVKTPGLDRIMNDSLSACQGADVVIFPFIMIWVYHIAEKMRLPCFLWDTHPLTPTRDFPSFTFTGMFPSWFSLAKYLPSWFRRGGGFNVLTHRVVQGVLLQIGLRLTNAWRRDELALPALSGTDLLWKFYNGGAAALYCYSPLAVPPPADWPSSHHITGYWFLGGGTEWRPSPELMQFLSEGPAPVCVGFGSSRDRNPERLTQIVLDALARAGCRGVLLTGRGGMTATQLPPHVFAAESIPHDWIFPRVAAVVHHGGAGTSAAVLRAGVPSVVVAWWGDMPFWADCLYRMGVSPLPIMKSRLTADKLANAISSAVNDSGMRARAVSIGERIRSEDGVARALEILGKMGS
jgi:UDP:flavonoid glycosyltransferase YjiC (YdhE family)